MTTEQIAIATSQEPVCMTEAQHIALLNILSRWESTLPEWISPEFHYDAILIKIGSMVIGIEVDGYAHS